MCILLLGESHLPGPVASVMMLWRAMSASLFSSEDRYRGRLVRALALSLVTFVLFLDPALAWQVTLPDTFGNTSGAPRGLAVDAEGNIFTAGDQSNRFVVTKLSGSTGQVLWRTIVQGSTIIAGVGLSVAVDSAGQVVASGQLTSSALHTEFAVVKLDGA